jgi:tetratricopeptide (TPR) repeat protein
MTDDVRRKQDQQALVVDDDLIERLLRGEKPAAQKTSSPQAPSIDKQTVTVGTNGIVLPAEAAYAPTVQGDETPIPNGNVGIVQAEADRVIAAVDAEEEPAVSPWIRAPAIADFVLAGEFATQESDQGETLPTHGGTVQAAEVERGATQPLATVEPVDPQLSRDSLAELASSVEWLGESGSPAPSLEPTGPSVKLGADLPEVGGGSASSESVLDRAVLEANIVNRPAGPMIHGNQEAEDQAMPDAARMTALPRTSGPQKATFSGSFAKAVSLASQGHLDEAIEELELGAQQGDDPIEVQSGLGHLRFEQQNWSESAHHYSEVAKAEPGHPTASYNWALCLERQGRFEDAAAAFGIALEADAHRWQAEMGRGLCLLRMGADPEQRVSYAEDALACLDAAVEKSKGLLSPQAGPGSYRTTVERAQDVLQFGRAIALHRLSRQREAAEIYEALLPAHPEASDLLANLVAVAIDEKQCAQVEELSGRLIDLEPTSRAALQGLVLAAMRRADCHSAILYGLEAVKQFPSSFSSWFNLGLAYQDAGQLADAREAYEHAVRLDPASADANASLAALLQAERDWVGARLAYRRALAARPNSLGTLWNLALVAEHEGNAPEAERLFTRVVALQPDWQDASYRLGLLQCAQGEYSRASESFFSFLRSHPEEEGPSPLHRDVHFNLGIALWKSGNLRDALQHFAKVLAMEPVDEEALQAISGIRCEMNDVSGAFESYQRATALGRVPAELSFNMGLLLRNTGDEKAALSCFQSALDQDPSLLPALVNAGLLLHQAGKLDQAMFLWSDALRLQPQLARGYFT